MILEVFENRKSIRLKLKGGTALGVEILKSWEFVEGGTLSTFSINMISSSFNFFYFCK